MKTRFHVFTIIIAALIIISCSPEPENVHLQVVEFVKEPIIEQGDPGTEDNTYGLEGGSTLKIDDTYHMFIAEVCCEPKVVKTRLAHWKSPDGLNFERVSTLYESSGNFDGTDDYASLWSPMPVFNEEENQWELFYVAYRSAPKLPGEFSELTFRNNTHGMIVRAASTEKGKDGIGGPYEDIGVILQPDENSDWWEGPQGTASFYPYKVGDIWLSFYCSWRSGHDWNTKMWFGAGLVSAPSLAGPWKRLYEYNPVMINNTFIENPIIFNLDNGLLLALFDSGFEQNTIGYSFSKDGYHWSKEKKIIFPKDAVPWTGKVRTPMSFIPQDDGTFSIYYTAFNSERFKVNTEPVHHFGYGTVGLLKVKVTTQ